MTQATFATHEVLNQSPPFEDVDLFAVDRPLAEAVAANGGGSAHKELSEFGQHWGSAAMAARGRAANENTPKLRTFDSRGQSGMSLVRAHCDLARRDPAYTFVLAEVDYLKPYWDAFPEERAFLRELIRTGRVGQGCVCAAAGDKQTASARSTAQRRFMMLSFVARIKCRTAAPALRFAPCRLRDYFFALLT